MKKSLKDFDQPNFILKRKELQKIKGGTDNTTPVNPNNEENSIILDDGGAI